LDAFNPLGYLGVNPISFIRAGANKTTEVAMSCRTLKVEIMKFSEGRGRGINWSNEDGFLRFREITASGTELEEETLGFCDGGYSAYHGSIVGIPWLS
jgi:hypothetical protein